MPTYHSRKPYRRSFIGEIAISFGFPLAMFAMGILPGCNRMYSGHGGLAWLIVPLCFPYVILRALIMCNTGQVQRRAWFRHFYAISIPAYLMISLPLSWAVSASVHHSFGLAVSAWTLFTLMVSPLPWLYFV